MKSMHDLTERERRLLRRALVLLELDISDKRRALGHVKDVAASPPEKLALEMESDELWDDWKALNELIRRFL